MKTKIKGIYTAKIVIHEGGKKRQITWIEAVLVRQLERGIKGDERATQGAIANARTFGVFDEVKMDEGACEDHLSDETIEQLSYDALQELIEIEKARLKKR